jgi:hypothetical protein
MSKILMPEGRKPTVAEIFPLSPRPTTLQGKTVALYHNDKVASFSIMKNVGRLMKEKMGVKEVFEVHSKAPFMRHPERAIQEALKADVAVTGTAD